MSLLSWHVISIPALLHLCVAFDASSAAIHGDVYGNGLPFQRLFTPKFVGGVSNVTIREGKEAVLVCTVDNLGSYKVSWMRLNPWTILTSGIDVITRDKRMFLSHGDNRVWYFHIENVTEADSGWYMCQINTEPASSQSAVITVVAPPRLVNKNLPSIIKVKEGDDVTLFCEFGGQPTPEVTWMVENNNRNGVLERVKVNGGEKLTLRNVHRSHSGYYVCIGTNGVEPRAEEKFEVIVEFPPSVNVTQNMLGAYLGQDVTLTCLIEASPSALIFWTTDDGSTLVNGDKYHLGREADTINGYQTVTRLRIMNIVHDDYRTYQCHARSSLGEIIGSIQLYDMPKPVSPKTDTVLLKGGSSTLSTPWLAAVAIALRLWQEFSCCFVWMYEIT